MNKIIFLRDSGFHIAEIAADALKNWDEAHVTELLENKRREIEGIITEEQRKLNKIDQAVRDISREQDVEVEVCMPVSKAASVTGAHGIPMGLKIILSSSRFR